MNWADSYTPADFDAKRADKRALRQAKQDAETGQAGLFHVATPEREAKRQQQAAELDGQDDLFGALTCDD